VIRSRRAVLDDRHFAARRQLGQTVEHKKLLSVADFRQTGRKAPQLALGGFVLHGPSNIRQYILENDWLDAIVQLSTDQFMNTGISTYIWVLCKDKPAYRCGKVQLIDASHCYEQRRKAIGTKRNDISDHCREMDRAGLRRIPEQCRVWGQVRRVL